MVCKFRLVKNNCQVLSVIFGRNRLGTGVLHNFGVTSDLCCETADVDGTASSRKVEADKNPLKN